MNLGGIGLLLCFGWLLSELVFAPRPEPKGAKQAHRASYGLLWLLILTCVPAGSFLGLSAAGFVDAPLLPGFGLLLMIMGVAVLWLAILTLKEYFTYKVYILNSHQLIKDGIYGFFRHPGYAGSLLCFLGLGLSFSSWVSTLVIFGPTLLGYLYRIEVEEKALLEVFGSEYVEYRKATKRLIPGLY